MNVSRKSLALFAVACLATAAHATDVTALDNSQGWFTYDTQGGATGVIDSTYGSDGSLHFNANGGPTDGSSNRKDYVAYFQGGDALGTIGGLSGAGSLVSADLLRSSSSQTPYANANVVVKLYLTGGSQLTWESTNNAGGNTTDSFVSSIMNGTGVWWLRTGGVNYANAGQFLTLSQWAAGQTIGGAAIGSGTNVIGFGLGFGSGVGKFEGAVDNLNVNFAGGTSYSFNFKSSSLSSVPGPAALLPFALGLGARLRRRKSA